LDEVYKVYVVLDCYILSVSRQHNGMVSLKISGAGLLLILRN